MPNDNKPEQIDQSIQVIEGQLSCIREVIAQGRETPIDGAEASLIMGNLQIIALAAKHALESH